MNKFIHLLDRISEWAGKAVSYLTAALVLLICYDVVMRYLFNLSQIWMAEVEIYLFALIFLFGSAYAFQKDKHVRVDVFYANFPPKKQAWINLLGGLFLLLPWCVVILIVSFDYAMTSFSMGEGSPQPGGLPALYLLKFSIFIGFLLLFLQGISSVFKSILEIREPSTPLK